MTRCSQLLLAGLFGCVGFIGSSPPASAQDRILGPSPSSRAALELYAEPGATRVVRRMAVAEMPTPLEIRESRARHHRIELDGQSFWIKGAHVRIARDSKAGCMTAKLAPTTQTIATPGALKNAC